MKRCQIQTLLVLLLLAVTLGCGPKATRPWVDLQEINDQIVRSPGKNQTQEMGKEGAATPQSRLKDMSVSGVGEHEFLKKGPVAAVSQKAEVGADGILLNFDNADIYEFIQVISETLGINYIVDPKIKGSVNIRSGQKIGKDQLFGVFQKILHINGLDVRNEGEYYSIHPSKGGVPQQVYGPTEAGSLKESSRLIVQVIPVVHLASAEAQKLVEPYLSEVGSIYNLASQNTIIVSDFESKVLDMVSVLARLDSSPLSALKVRMVRVENAPLFTLRDELQEILTALTINPKEHEAVSVLALERVNSLLLISKSEQLLDSTDRWIRELDVVPSEGQTVYIYNVRNSVASELAAVVNSVIEGEDLLGKAPGDGATPLKSGLETGTQARGGFDAGTQGKTPFGIGGETQARAAAGQNQSGLRQDSSLEASNKPMAGGKVASLRGGANSRTTTDKKNKPPSLHFAGEPLLLADDTRNIILIRALTPDYTRLVKLLERLDNLPRQVLIEVLVAEVTLNDSWEFGIEWALKNNQLKIDGTNYGQTFKTDFASSIKSGFSYSVFRSTNDVVGLLNALAAETDVSLLSSPQILVLNNEQAFVNVGDQVPIVTTETERVGSTDYPVVDKTIQYKDTGTILKVRPRINYDGVVILDIDQQVSAAIENKLGGTNSPIISTRELKTKLAVKNGQSIMMGGLIKKGNTTTQNKIPLLGDIPLLGWAFKYEKQSNAKTELLVMITPYVIESDDVLDQYIKKFQEKMQGLRKGLDVKQPAAAASRPAKSDKQAVQGDRE
ncbi:MAG: type II secretion system secretin GspD [Desulfobulbaceae bacterium]|nr:type II secretion system secretin GspD [Desulfobulbaceae bacterium]HIJ90340.1 type II secretion system secretin GspD [Deltaproteobacteria bacterium]